MQVDPRAVAEVIYTLVDNAAKYSPAGKTILVTAEQSDDEMIRIAVENQGQSIPKALRERVFDKFFRAIRDGDTQSSRQPKGTGMGLAFAKGIVEAHGGLIWIEDTTDDSGGTRVVFILPIGDSGTMPEPSSEIASGATPSGETLRVS